MIVHDGHSIPTFPDGWDPNDQDWIWFVWDDLMLGAAITGSTWVLPDGFTEVQAKTSQSVVDYNGVKYHYTNGILLSVDSTADGTFSTISNQVILSDGRKYERSVRIVLVNQ